MKDTVRPPPDTARPGDGGVSLEEYAGLISSTRPPGGQAGQALSLDDLIGSILDQHERERGADVDSLWPDP